MNSEDEDGVGTTGRNQLDRTVGYPSEAVGWTLWLPGFPDQAYSRVGTGYYVK